jgi:hypothetical protein
MKKDEASWYDPLKLARTAFYDELVTTGVMKEKDSQYPQASAEVEQMKTEYYTLPLGTGQRTRYAASHPALVDYWNKVGDYYDKVGAAFGLPPAPPYGSTGYSSTYASTAKKYAVSNIKSGSTKGISTILKKMGKGKKLKVSSVKSALASIKAPKKRKSVKQMLAKAPVFKASKPPKVKVLT